MIILSNITRIHKIRIVYATLLAVSMINALATFDHNMVQATSEKNDNAGQQIDKQGQWVSQGAQCVSGEAVLFSCNNVGIESQEQHGYLAAGQQ
jgi:hypothetical protein